MQEESRLSDLPCCCCSSRDTRNGRAEAPSCPLQTNCFGRLEVHMSGELVGETADHFWTPIESHSVEGGGMSGVGPPQQGPHL